MLVVRYFGVVGSVLLALLFVANAYFPNNPQGGISPVVAAAADVPSLRVHSDRKWPERIDLDTVAPITSASIATPAPKITANAPAETAAQVALEVRPPAASAQQRSTSKARQAFARMEPASAEPSAGSVRGSAAGSKTVQRRRMAKPREAPPIVVAQQPRYGFFFNDTW